jgi:lysophospholipase L1-like esterase
VTEHGFESKKFLNRSDISVLQLLFLINPGKVRLTDPFYHKGGYPTMFEKTKSQNVSASIHVRLFRYSIITLTVLAGVLLIFAMCHKSPTSTSSSEGEWVGTWACAPQLAEPSNKPPSRPGITDNSLRQIVQVSMGGSRLRVRFSNEFSTTPVTMKAVHFASALEESAIDPDTDVELLFDGLPEVTMEAGGTAMSDPFDFDLQPLSRVTITIHFGETSEDVTGHPGSRTTSYLLEGNKVSAEDFVGGKLTVHWFVINGIDVMADESAGAVAVMGNSITDGRGSTTDEQNRWTDQLARCLQEDPATQDVGVLNMALGGNCVLRFCVGPAALERFERDVIYQPGVRWLIILEGVNDIGQPQDEAAEATVASDLIAAYEQMIDAAHAEDILVYGATILPMQGSQYDTEENEAARQTVNEWIRTSGRFDAVIDFDAVMRDPNSPLALKAELDTDHLHPNADGYQVMGEAVDLSLFK